MFIELTPLILTFNEASNLRRTLVKLSWANEILLLDSFSTDETINIAQNFPQVRVIQRHFDSFASQCNFGLTQVRTPWALSMDADYVLTSELVSEIQKLREPPIEVNGYSARFRYCVWGHALRSTLYPPRAVLYRRERARYCDEGHGHRVKIEGRVLPLTGFIDHDDRKPLSRWLSSQNRYMVIEARHLLSTPDAALSIQDRLRKRIYLAPPIMFLYLLLGRGLILDGWPGWYYVMQRTLAEILLSLRLLAEREKLES